MSCTNHTTVPEIIFRCYRTHGSVSASFVKCYLILGKTDSGSVLKIESSLRSLFLSDRRRRGAYTEVEDTHGHRAKANEF